VKLGANVVVLLAAYGGGLALRSRGYGRTGEGLFVLGGGLWLVGIALIGQLYNLSGRPYGIERFYVPEGRGMLPRGRVEAEISLPSSGRALLTRLFVDGRPYP
jgi:Predicted membrane protein (DUF2157)